MARKHISNASTQPEDVARRMEFILLLLQSANEAKTQRVDARTNIFNELKQLRNLL